MKCPFCKEEISAKLENCPYCKGSVFKTDLRKKDEHYTQAEREMNSQEKKGHKLSGMRVKKWSFMQLDVSVSVAFISIAVPYALIFLHNEFMLFTDLIGSAMIVLINMACDYIVIPWTVSTMIVKLILGVIKCIKERVRPQTKEFFIIAAVFVLLFLYISYTGNTSITLLLVLIFSIIKGIIAY